MKRQAAKAQNGARPLDRMVRVSSRQISCQLAGESVILHLEEGVYYGLNEVASRVWELIQQPRTVRDVRDALVSEYEIEEALCTQDLLDLLAKPGKRTPPDASQHTGIHPLAPASARAELRFDQPLVCRQATKHGFSDGDSQAVPTRELTGREGAVRPRIPKGKVAGRIAHRL